MNIHLKLKANSIFTAFVTSPCSLSANNWVLKIYWCKCMQKNHIFFPYVNNPSKNFHLHVSRQNSHFRSTGDISRKGDRIPEAKSIFERLIPFSRRDNLTQDKWGENCISDTSHSTSAPVLTQHQEKTCSLLLPSAWAPDRISSQFGLWIAYSMHPGTLVQSCLVGHCGPCASVGPAWPCSAEPLAAAGHGPCSALRLHTLTKLWAAPCTSWLLATFARWQETRPSLSRTAETALLTPSIAPF